MLPWPLNSYTDVNENISSLVDYAVVLRRVD
jgi:hypothetical protein